MEEGETNELMLIELNPPVEGEDQQLLEDSVTTSLAKSIIQKIMASDSGEGVRAIDIMRLEGPPGADLEFRYCRDHCRSSWMASFSSSG